MLAGAGVRSLQRVVAVLAVVVGVGFIVLTFTESLPGRTQAGQRVLDKFRHVTADQRGFAQLKRDMDGTVASGDQFLNEMAPALAEDLGMSKRRFERYIASNFPRIAAGAEGTPEGNAFLKPFVATLVETQDEFERVEDIPTRSLSLTTTPWMLLGAGVLLLGAGLVALRTPGRASLAAVAVIGAGLIVVPLAWELPGKTDDADKVVEVARAGLDPKTAALSSSLNSATDQIITDTQVGLIPDVADRTNVSVAALTRRLQREFPDTMTYLERWPSIEDRNAVLLDGMATGYSDFQEAQKIPFTTLPWLVIAPGIALFLIAAAALLPRAREPTGQPPPTDRPAPTDQPPPATPWRGPR